jgi:hypothetical protein
MKETTSILNSWICNTCNIEKDISEFKKTNNGFRRKCKRCQYYPYKEQDKERVKEWRKENKQRSSLLRKRHRTKLRQTKPWVSAMKSILHDKRHRIYIKDSEYSYTEFKLHIESLFNNNMNWENYGEYWEIDHIKPRSRFTYEQRYECHSLKNLQPLEVYTNRYIKKCNDL